MNDETQPKTKSAADIVDDLEQMNAQFEPTRKRICIQAQIASYILLTYVTLAIAAFAYYTQTHPALAAGMLIGVAAAAVFEVLMRISERLNAKARIAKLIAGDTRPQT